MAIQREYRLRLRNSFSYIYKKGEHKSGELIVVYRIPARNLKIGVSVGKKVGNSVIRSQVKRRISERFRLLIPLVDQRSNFVVVARGACANATSAAIEEELKKLLKELRVLA